MLAQEIAPVSPNQALLFEDPITSIDLVGEVVDDQRESQELERLIADQVLDDRGGYYRRQRATAYVARAGVRTRCPECEDGEGRVDRWGVFECENCGYSNAAELPRQSDRDGDEALA